MDLSPHPQTPPGSKPYFTGMAVWRGDPREVWGVGLGGGVEICIGKKKIKGCE